MIANPNDGNTPQVEQATPQISVSAAGLITAKTEQEKGYVPGGTKFSTKQLPTQAAKTVTPGTTNQTAVASGRYTTGDVVVAGDANLTAENIAEGVTIFGVTGTHSGGGQLYSVTDDEHNSFYPKQAAAGEFVTTVNGYISTNQTQIYDATGTYVLGEVRYTANYESLPPQVKEIVDQYSQTSNATEDTPITRLPPEGMDGYMYFIMPTQDVVIQTS